MSVGLALNPPSPMQLHMQNGAAQGGLRVLPTDINMQPCLSAMLMSLAVRHAVEVLLTVLPPLS